ncbi:sigma-54 interaction domain-containing protein [Sphaerochaeta sp.]|uniref:sigma-54 interaction domain-containing protein n=1 Tax=Sphaerochaeta sp. TaxID=1972642 RepID=UPI003D0F6A64
MRKNTKTQLCKPIVLSSCDPLIWDQVRQAKQIMIETGYLPTYADFIPEEIVFMWERSIKYGIVWDGSVNVPHLTDAQFEAVKERKKLFIDIATEFIAEFQGILEDTEFTMSITDESGVILTKTMNSDRIWHNKMSIDIGDVWNEQYVGCTAHTLALAYNRPVQIIGPVNFFKVLENNISSAAPIFNEYGDTIGTIRLVQKNADISRLMTHTLGWVTSVATAISGHLKLSRRDKRLKLMNSTLNATFAHTEDGYFSIDESGYVIHMNKEASKLLNLGNEKIKSSFFNILTDSTLVKDSLKSGRAMLNQHLSVDTGEVITFTADIEPFFGERKKHAQGAVIRIKRKSDLIKTKKDFSTSNITFNRIIGKCTAMETLKETAKLIAKKPINVLLLGESGTGKEVFAQAIHNHYNQIGPFIAINCASIPANLIESELFGYEPGAFTGAEKQGRKGKIEYADGGTLFLDEIGDMPMELQPVLLRVLEEKRVTRIGGHKSIPVDFRVIAATNKPMCGRLAENNFRQDLYFRLSVVNLEIPPLRQRGEDILLLADNFIKNICSNFNIPACTLSADAEKLLLEFNWPGNVRQLQNAMTYAVTVASSRTIYPCDLPKDITENDVAVSATKLDDIRNIEKQVILRTIKDMGNATEAAKYLGISRATLYRKVKE